MKKFLLLYLTFLNLLSSIALISLMIYGISDSNEIKITILCSIFLSFFLLGYLPFSLLAFVEALKNYIGEIK